MAQKRTLILPLVVDSGFCSKCGEPNGSDHIATTIPPLASTIRSIWRPRGYARSTDGCRIGFNDHYCVHNHQSWRDVLKSLKLKGRPRNLEEVVEEDDALDWIPEDLEDLEEVEEEVQNAE